MSKILVVEDEVDLAEQLRKSLVRDHHVVEVVHSGTDAINYLRVSNYDLIILDWMLPGQTGIEVCRFHRDRGDVTPVLMLTARSAIEDKEQGLDAGADDYLTKPFHLREFGARIRALLRRGKAVSNVLVSGDLELDPAARRVSFGDKEIKLEPKEFNLLEFLMRNPDQVFSAEALVMRVWESSSDISPDAIRVYIRGIRKKLDEPSGKSFIVTVHGSGYKFNSQDA